MQFAIQTPVGVSATGVHQLITHFGFADVRQRQLADVPFAAFDGVTMSTYTDVQAFTIFEVSETTFPKLELVIAALEGFEIGLNREGPVTFHLLSLEEDSSERRMSLEDLLRQRAHEASLRQETLGEEYAGVREAQSALHFVEDLLRRGPETG